MEKYKIELYGIEYEIIKDDDGKFIKPDFLLNIEPMGSAMKPAHEPIVMARKPLSEKSIAENVLKHGTGGINIDGSRIEIGDEKVPRLNVPYEHKANNNFGGGNDGRFGTTTMSQEEVNGRFPANIIFDEEAGKLLDEQSDKASRFFYCPKTSKKDRNEGLDNFEDKVGDIDKQAKRRLKCADCDNWYVSGNKEKECKCLKPNWIEPKTKNNHPTVKPTDLMRYLINLVTPKGGTTLDPFMGSGSTGKAAVRCGVNFIGIEKEEEYMKIAEARIEYENKN